MSEFGIIIAVTIRTEGIPNSNAQGDKISPVRNQCLADQATLECSGVVVERLHY